MTQNERTTGELLNLAGDRAIRYLNVISDRAVAPSREAIERLSDLGGPLPVMGGGRSKA